MPIKTLSKGSTTAQVHPRPDTAVDSPALRPDMAVRPGFETATSIHPPFRPGGSTDTIDPDAITSAPVVTVHSSASANETPRAVGLPLEDYRVTAAVDLPAANLEGFRVHKGRQALRAQPRSDGLFNTLERLKHTATGHPQLQGRVWRLIDSITENTPQSERLRNEVFDRAGEAACCDRAAFTFANLETAAMMHNAVAQAGDKSQGPELFKLSRALFRLHEVDKIASADIARREAKIAAGRSLQEAARLPAPHVSEEIEIRLFYRHGLKDRLQLPGQPEEMGFAHLAGVSKAQMESAYQSVIARDNSAEEFQALVSREFWQKYLTHKFQENFETQRQPFQDRQAALDESFSANELSFADYDAQSKAMQAEWMIEEAALIETLSRQELAQYKASGTDKEAAGTRSS